MLKATNVQLLREIMELLPKLTSVSLLGAVSEHLIADRTLITPRSARLKYTLRLIQKCICEGE